VLTFAGDLYQRVVDEAGRERDRVVDLDVPGRLPPGSLLDFHSDVSFSPKLLGMSPDDRVLAFQLRVAPVS